MKSESSKNNPNFFRNFVFGVEDSLVSTVGILSGIAIADTPRPTIILTGVVLIFVEAFSMGVGSFLSDHSVFQKKDHNRASHLELIKSSAIMFISYFFAGFIPLSPYLFTQQDSAFQLSIIFALITLFILGLISAKKFKGNLMRKGLEMLIVGGIAVFVGVIVGTITHNLGN